MADSQSRFKLKRPFYRSDYAQIIVGKGFCEIITVALSPLCPILDDLCANVGEYNPVARELRPAIIMRKQFPRCILNSFMLRLD